jgi:hypothetical protein
MRELHLESLRFPALALAGEAFLPVGPARGNAAFSAKAIATRTFSFGRVHLNGSYGSYSVQLRPAPVNNPACRSTPEGCPVVPYLPPIDGPCLVALNPFIDQQSLCSALPIPSSPRFPVTSSNAHWLVGVAADKALPLRSILLVADVFVERFEGLGRPADWTVELGMRRQVSPWLVVDGAIGRHYLGTSLASFVTFGTTVSHSVFFGRLR